MNVYAPKLWEKTAPLLLRWLRAVLEQARPQLEMTEGNPRGISPIFAELASELAIQHGFLASDPRRDDIVGYTQGILEDDLSSYWRGLTDPLTLAKRLQTLREQGLSYVEQTRALDRDYRSGFYRAERLVRSSYNSSANYANYTQMAEFYDELKWLTARDSRVRPSRKGEFFDHRHADGQIVPVGQPFIVSGERLRFPGDRSLGASAGNIVNCRCTLRSVNKKPAPKTSSPGRLASVSAPPRAFTSRDQATTSSQRQAMETWGKQHYSDWEDSLSGEEHKALRFYQGIGYKAINGFLRDPVGTPENVRAELAPVVRYLDGAISRARLPHAAAAYRGTRGHWPPSEVKPGDEPTERSYLSTTLDISIAKDFARWESNPRAAIIEIELPAGVNAAWLEGLWNRQEYELLLPRGCTLKVLGVDYEEGRRYIRCRLITKS